MYLTHRTTFASGNSTVTQAGSLAESLAGDRRLVRAAHLLPSATDRWIGRRLKEATHFPMRQSKTAVLTTPEGAYVIIR